MTNAEKIRAFRARAKAAGLCARCGQRPPDPGVTSCAECRAASNERSAWQWFRLKKAAKKKARGQ